MTAASLTNTCWNSFLTWNESRPIARALNGFQYLQDLGIEAQLIPIP